MQSVLLLNDATPEGEKRKSLGSNIPFREDIDLGYRITPAYSGTISYNHMSTADPGVRNDVGIRFDVKF